MSNTSEKPTRGSVAAAARDRARLNRARLEHERAKRDESIENAAAEFFQLDAETKGLRDQLAEAESKQGAAILNLRSLGEKDPWIAELLETERSEVARLAKLAPVERHELTD